MFPQTLLIQGVKSKRQRPRTSALRTILLGDSIAKKDGEKCFWKRRSPSVLQLQGRDIVVMTKSVTIGISCTVKTSRCRSAGWERIVRTSTYRIKAVLPVLDEKKKAKIKGARKKDKPSFAFVNIAYQKPDNKWWTSMRRQEAFQSSHKNLLQEESAF